MSGMQLMLQLVAAPGGRAELADWCLGTLAPALAANAAVQRLIVNLACENPLPDLYPGESLQGEDFDAVVQAWLPSLADWREAIAPFEAGLAKRVGVRFDYRLSDTTAKADHDGQLAGTPSPGYKLMRGLYFCADLPPAAARRQWAHHAELAVQVHVGVARYAQHWVDEVLTPGAPAIGGLSDLHFPSLEAMRERYFDSPRGKREILHDIGHFIAGGSKRFYGREFRIK